MSVPEIGDLLKDPAEFISRLTIMHKERQRLSPFELNEPQKKLLDVLRTSNRVIILKARQMGISTLVRGWHFWQTYMASEPKQYAVISHTRDSAEELHRMEKTFYDNLPVQLRRPLSKSSSRTLTFEDSGATVRTHTASGKGGARSFAMNSVHLSEFAFYDNQEETMATVMAAVGEGQIIIESTPNTPGDKFHELVDGALKGENGWTLVFFPWFAHDAYRVEEIPGWYIPTGVEKMVQQQLQITTQQLCWRKQQLKTLGQEKFIREYPATIEEAFRSRGVQFFDPAALAKIEPLEMGSHEHRQYAPPMPGEAYVLGVDVGSGLGKKTDFSAITVISGSTRQPVYHFISNTTPPGKLAEEIVKVWTRYHQPKVIVESNGNGQWVLHKLKELKVKGLYKDDKGRPFRTTVGTRPSLFQAIKEVVDNGIITQLDQHVLDELKTIVYIRDKPQAAKRKNDDVTISMALCYYLLERMPLMVSHSVKRAMMEKHIASMKAKKSNRTLPWNVRGGNKTGGY
jgi:hypothetical protein